MLVNKPLPDHYYFSDQDDSSEYYDNVDEISIPSIKPPLHNKKSHSPSSIRTSSSTLSHSTAPALIYVRPNNALHENSVQFRLPEYKDTRYDQSTLKSFFMNSPSSSEAVRTTTTTTERPTTTQKITTTSDGRRDFEAQRQKILSFIISENQPSSFKAPSTTTPKSLVLATNKEINSNHANYIRAFVNTQESTTLSHPNTTSTNSPRAQVNQSPTKTTLLLSRDQLAPSKPIRLTLSASLGASNLEVPSSNPGTQKQFTQGNVEEIPLIKSRQQEARQSLHLKPIEPTTYSPQKPFRVTTESTTTTTTTSELPTSILLEDEMSEMDPFVVHSRRRPYVNDFLTNANIPTRFPPRSTTTTEIPVDVNEFTTQAPSTTATFRSIIQTFTSRGLVFKENLNRTFEPQNLKPIVSPYISLETQRLTNAIRTTSPNSFDFSSSKLTSTAAPATPSTYRSYFLITAPVTASTTSKDSSFVVKGAQQPSEVRGPIPSTFLFPETSSARSTSTAASPPPSIRPSPFVVNTESNSISSTENSRGRYRPFVTFTSQNSIDEEPTTYAPRVRFNTRTQTMDDSISPSLAPTDQPVARRKIVRLKSALVPPSKPADDFFSSTDHNRIDATTPSTPLREVSARFVASPSRETSKYAPKEVVGKLSYSSDIRNSFSQLPKEETSPTVDITDKPFFYIRFKNASTNLEPVETSTKKFRATVEMPEMNVPTEKELIAFVQQVHEEIYDDEASNHGDSLLDVVGGEHEVDDYALVDGSKAASTTAAPKFAKTQFNTTYSTVYATSTSPPLTTTSLRTTEHEPTTTTTANPKSLIPPRTSRVNSAIKTSIVAGLPRRNSASSIKCNDISANAKCNEIPSRYRTKKQNHSI